MRLFFFKIFQYFTVLKIDKFNKVESLEILNYIDGKCSGSLLSRSKKQYLCHTYLQNKFIVILLNILALIFLPFVFIFLITFVSFKSPAQKKSKNNTAVAFYIKDDLIPRSLGSRFDIVRSQNLSCTKKDFLYIVRVSFKCWMYPFFLLKFVFKIFLYSNAINSKNASAILTSSEYTFLSSALTDYCHYNGVKHINIMHGEKLFCIRDSFFKFDEMYVWDEHYINLFFELKAYDAQFICELPPLFLKSSAPFESHNESKIKIVKYYLEGNQSRSEIILIDEWLRDYFGVEIVFRPHPLYSKIKEIETYGIRLESVSVPIVQSIEESDFVVSMYSTVLFQANLMGKEVIIDDVSNIRLFNYIRDSDYIMLNKKHKKMSAL